MSATVGVQFITKAAVLPTGGQSVTVVADMAAGPDGGYGGTLTIHLRTAREAEVLIHALTTARDQLTGVTP